MGSQNLMRKIWNGILDFIFGAGSQMSEEQKKRKFSLSRPYCFLPRLRAKPQYEKDVESALKLLAKEKKK